MNKRREDSLIWEQLGPVLEKWGRNETLDPDEHKILVDAQEQDIEKYYRMREKVRS